MHAIYALGEFFHCNSYNLRSKSFSFFILEHILILNVSSHLKHNQQELGRPKGPRNKPNADPDIPSPHSAKMECEHDLVWAHFTKQSSSVTYRTVQTLCNRFKRSFSSTPTKLQTHLVNSQQVSCSIGSFPNCSSAPNVVTSTSSTAAIPAHSSHPAISNLVGGWAVSVLSARASGMSAL